MRGTERGLHVAALDEIRLENVVVAPHDGSRRERVVNRVHRRERIDLNRDGAAGALDQPLVGMRQQHDGLFGVIHDLVRKARLIVEDERDAIGRRDVLGHDDRELVPGQIAGELDRPDAPARH
jgi:hypothetical protein